MNARLAHALLLITLAAGSATFAAEADWPKFTDITEAAGVKFKHNLGDLEMSNIAVGSRVTVKGNGMVIVQPVVAVNGYLTSSDPRPHFGLGKADQAESVEVLWPDGKRQALANVLANQIVNLKQAEAK